MDFSNSLSDSLSNINYLYISIVCLVIHLITLMISSISNLNNKSSFVIYIFMYTAMEVIYASILYYTAIGEYPASEGCSFINELLTVALFFLIWMQPFIYGIIGISQDLDKNSKLARWSPIIIISCTIFIAVVINISLPSLGYGGVLIPGTNFQNNMCTYMMIDSQYSISLTTKIGYIQLQPTYLFHFILIGVSILMYSDKNVKAVVGMGWIGTLIFSIYCFWPNLTINVFSFWHFVFLLTDFWILVLSFGGKSKNQSLHEKQD